MNKMYNFESAAPRISTLTFTTWFCNISWQSKVQKDLFFITRALLKIHKTLAQCWFNVGRPSTTLAQHQTNIGSIFSQISVC